MVSGMVGAYRPLWSPTISIRLANWHQARQGDAIPQPGEWQPRILSPDYAQRQCIVLPCVRSITGAPFHQPWLCEFNNLYYRILSINIANALLTIDQDHVKFSSPYIMYLLIRCHFFCLGIPCRNHARVFDCVHKYTRLSNGPQRAVCLLSPHPHHVKSSSTIPHGWNATNPVSSWVPLRYSETSSTWRLHMTLFSPMSGAV
jgi:hypothetical protein